VLLSMLLFLSGVRSYGQGTDTLAGIRTFIKVCNIYKQLPLQLNVTLRNTTNLVTAEEDTLSLHAHFCLQQNGSYIGMGELEQIADDSLLVLVSNKLHRMIVYTHRSSISDQLKGYLGLQLEDSSLLRMAARFKAFVHPEGNDSSVVEMKSRGIVYNTGLARESISVMYCNKDLQPSQVIHIMRSLMPVTRAVYEELTARGGYEGRLVELPDSSFCVVKEKVSSFMYDAVSHAAGIKLPATASDRIVRDASGNLRPAEAYHDFQIIRDL